MKGKHSHLQNHQIQVYAQAIFELAKEHDCVERVFEEFELIVRLLEIPAFKAFLELPLFERENRGVFIDKVFAPSLSEIFVNFLKVLLDSKHFRFFEEIFAGYRRQADEYLKRVRAVVVTATPVSREVLDEIAAALQVGRNETVVVKGEVEPSLLGGLVVQIGDLWINASLQRRLEVLRRQLERADLRGLHAQSG